MQDSENTQSVIGRVIEVSRRYVTVLTEQGAILTGTLSSKAMLLATGDSVSFEERNGKVFVTSVHDASRCLFRSYRGAIRRMGANIDHLFVITAVGETLQPLAIDRMILAGRVENIPLSLVVNKKDLGLEHVAFITSVYEKMGIPVLPVSAKAEVGLEQLRVVLDDDKVKTAALCGVSGVGKSTILNKLVPDAKARIGEVSVKTGQGRQTTSQPRGFIYEASIHRSQKVLIDFPGIGFFGLSHLNAVTLPDAFDEMRAMKGECRFLDCRHLQEPGCVVRDKIESGEIAPWRYQSYLQILAEIEDAKEY